MQVEMEKREGAEVSLKVEIPEEKVKEELSLAFRKLAKGVRIPGFRKGKVPRKIFEMRFGEGVLQEEAIKNIYPEVYREALNQYQLLPIMEPELEIVQFSPDRPLILRMNLITKPEIELGRYRGVKVKRNKIEITEEEVASVLKQYQKNYATYVPIEGQRGVGENDWLVIDCQAFFEGKRLTGFPQKNFVYQVGSRLFPPSFSQGLMELKKGEEKEIEVEFPSNDPRKELAGRKVTFKVSLKEIKEEKLPPLDDDFAKELKFESLEAAAKYARERLKEAKEDWEKKRIRQEIVDKVVEPTEMEIPARLVEGKTEEKIAELKGRLKSQSLSLSEYLSQRKMSEKDLKDDLASQITKDLKTFFTLEAIAEKEKIKVGEEEIEKRLKASLKGSQKEEEIAKLKKKLAEQGQLGVLAARIKEEKVVDFLYNEAKIGL
jgi:trigger factor